VLTDGTISSDLTGKLFTLTRESLKLDGSVETFVQVIVWSTDRSTEALEVVLDGKVIVRALCLVSSVELPGIVIKYQRLNLPKQGSWSRWMNAFLKMEELLFRRRSCNQDFGSFGTNINRPTNLVS
jgi:hypothetical protein